MAIKEKNGNTFPHELFKVGDLVTFQWDDTLKDGIVLVVDAYGTFESPNIPAQVRKSVDSPPGMLTEDHHHTVHEERQVCYSSHLRPKSLHL